MASEVGRLLDTVKRLLKAKGKTYRDVAAALKISEPSVKRLFSNGRFSIDRLAGISQLLGLTMAELLQEAAEALPRLQALQPAQEQQLVAEPELLLVAACALNHWSAEEIVATYRITPAACIRQLLKLDRMGLVEVLPGNRIRLRIARDFDWLADGPIRRFFREHGQDDFLASAFGQQDESLEFLHGMLTPKARGQLQLELRRLRATLASLHAESAASRVGARSGVGLLLACREWEPALFRSRRRRQPASAATDE